MRVVNPVLAILIALGGLAGVSQAQAATYTEDTVGPVELVRERGKPRVDELALDAPYPLEHSQYTLILENRTTDGYWDDFMEWLGKQGLDIGPDRRPLPVQIALNGERLAKPTIVKGVTELPLDLVNGENALRLRLVGKPGDKLRARVRVVVTDNELPVINALVEPLANEAGWHGTGPTVSFECSDQITGIEFCSEPVSVAEGADQTITGTARDKAGNESTASVVLDVDLTAPVLDLALTPTPNEAGWQNQAVTADFTCTDNLSGVVECPASATFEAENAEHRIEETIQDVAGHTASASATFGIDLTAPTISASLTPAANANGWHSEPATVSYSCNDVLSGVVQCPADQTASEDGADIALTASVSDRAGNTTPVETRINLDQTAPVLSQIAPAAGEPVASAKPTLAFGVEDLAPDAASAALSANGAAIAADCTLAEGTLNCAVADGLGPDPVDVTLSLADRAGNVSTLTVSLTFDLDRDGALAHQDICPDTPTDETANEDGCSPSQLDDDNDGVINSLDQCPDTPEGVQVDDTGCPLDADNDGVLDDVDQCLNTEPGRAVAEDGCDPSQRDTDGDGVLDINDAFPLDSNESSDLDGDGIGDNADPDRDGDGVANDQDAFPDNGTEVADFDGDNIGDNSDTDRDNDGVPNDQDPFPLDPNRSSLPVVTIDSPQSLSTLGASPVEVTGTVDTAAASLTVNGTEVGFDSQGNWSANVHLEEGHNTVSARMVDSEGLVSTAAIALSLDLTPPYLTIESHEDGQQVFTDTVAVTGLVNDLVRGTVEESEAVVEVNGVTAQISNRSYLAENIPLNEGANTLTVRGTDQAGNIGEKQITLHYTPSTGERIEILNGQGQRAGIETVLAEPLRVRVLDAQGQPTAGESVVFRVTQGNGVVGVGTDAEAQAVLIDTDSQGIAETRFRIGQRAGQGTHKVRAKVVGYEEEALFYASAEPAAADRIHVNSGNNQRGAVYRPLPAPFVVTASDPGANFIQGARVRFQVVKGGGLFQNGEPVYETTTDGDGRAFAHLTLGGQTGLDQQRVVATLLDGPEGENITAGFTASGFHPGPAGDTAISGVVVNNQDQPMPGVTVRVDGTTRSAVADDQGRFTIENAPVGPVHLVADGSTAEAEGEYPSLSYNLVTVSGVDNPLAAPIYMVRLNEANKIYAGPQDAVVTLDDMPGFKLEIPAGSVTFPDGSREGYVSVTRVNANKVPMTPPDGMQPNLVVTIQPTGAKFDPPARLTVPNIAGLKPGTQTEMQSYDHDLEEFVAIGLGTVSRTGNVIRSNPGVGVVKAGWHFPARQPDPSGDGESSDCEGKPGTCAKAPGGGGDPQQCPIEDTDATGGTNPINLVNGNKFERETDYIGVGPFPLKIEHTYNSRYGGWRHGYQYSVQSLTDMEYRELMGLPLFLFGRSGGGGDGTSEISLDSGWFEPKYRLLSLADGKQIVFEESEITPGKWRSDIEPYAHLEESSWGYLYTNTRTGRTLLFDGQGRITQIRNRAGRSQKIHYTEGKVIVNDELGNSLRLTLDDAGKVKKAEIDDLVFEYRFSGANLTKTIFPDGSTKQYLYENGRFPYLTGIIDEAGNRVATWQYDKYGRAILSQHAAGSERKLVRYNPVERDFEFEFSASSSDDGGGSSGSVNWRKWFEEPEVGSVTVTNELDRITTYHFEKVNGRRRITHVEGDATPNCPAAAREKTFNDKGLMVSSTDWQGVTSTFGYDSGGRKTRQTDAEGTAFERTSTWSWDSTTGQLAAHKQPGRTESRSYNADGRLEQRQVGDRVWTYAYYDSGLLKRIDGPRSDVNDVTTFTYDAGGNMTSVTNALGQTTELKDHTAWHLPQTVVDPNGVVTKLAYDNRGRLTRSTLKSRDGDAVTTYDVDERGLVTAITPPNGVTVHYEYDAAQRLTAIANDQGDRIEYSLDAMGNRTEERVIGAGGELVRVQRRLHDALGRLLENIGARGQSTRYDYDPNGNATGITDPRGNRVHQAFDPLDRLQQSQDPLQKTVQFGYDARDNLTSVTDQRGLTTSYEYNQHNQVTQRTSPDTGVTTFTYDNAGNIATRTDARGVTAEYSYDALNRLTSVHYPDDPGRGITYTYDQSNTGATVAPEDYNAGIGRLTQLQDHSGTTRFRYDEQGNLIEDRRTVTVAGSPYTYSVHYQYSLAGQLTALTYPDGTEISYSYNAEGEVSALDADIAGDLLDTTLANNIRYQPFGPVRQLTWGNGLTLTRTFDQDGRIQRQSIPGVQDLDYGFDPNSNITRIRDGIAQTYSATYGYDEINRLINEATEREERDYDYDGVGNRTEQIITDKTENDTTTEDYSYSDTSNRLMAVNGNQYQYDAVGNTINDGEFGYAYDVTNRMSRASKNGSPVAHYRYNALGQRTVKHRAGNGQTTVFAYNQRGQLVSEVTFDADRDITERKHYVWLNRMPIAQLQPAANDSDYEVLYLHADHLNAPRKATNADQKAVWRWKSEAFGSDVASNDPDADGVKAQVNLRFPGQYSDLEIKSNYNYLRSYSPALGRYRKSDFFGLIGGTNTYNYTYQNPVLYTDPSGAIVPALVACALNPVCATAVRAGVGAIIGGLSALMAASSDPCFDGSLTAVVSAGAGVGAASALVPGGGALAGAAVRGGVAGGAGNVAGQFVANEGFSNFSPSQVMVAAGLGAAATGVGNAVGFRSALSVYRSGAVSGSAHALAVGESHAAAAAAAVENAGALASTALNDRSDCECE